MLITLLKSEERIASILEDGAERRASRLLDSVAGLNVRTQKLFGHPIRITELAGSGQAVYAIGGNFNPATFRARKRHQIVKIEPAGFNQAGGKEEV